VFRATIVIEGDGLVLSRQTVRIVVPRRPPPALDAGPADGGLTDESANDAATDAGVDAADGAIDGGGDSG
jgi:hypothetical protein